MTMDKTVYCRICGTTIDFAVLDLEGPALTSTNEQVAMPTRVYVCESCGHVQSADFPDIEAYYDTRFKCQLSSEAYDDLYEIRDGNPVYRSDAQGDAVLNLIAPAPGSKILDYGAAKAATLRKIWTRRPDLSPHVFDVSDDYRSSWANWLPSDAMATYEVPETWRGRFDLVTAHYVLEHVEDPLETLHTISNLLAPGGRLFFSVPDWTANTGDFLVAEHMNHFTRVSIRRLAHEAGFIIDKIDSTSLPYALVVVCSKSEKHTESVAKNEIEAAVAQASSTASAWIAACRQLEAEIAANSNRSAAIFGAGFYGAFILTRMGDRSHIACCVDNNHHLWGKTIFGVPVVSPEMLPSTTEVVYVGLNPARARPIASTVPALQRPGLEFVFIEA